MNFLSYLTPQLLEVFYSKVNGEIKIVESFGRKAIYVDGAPQSGAEIRPMWEEIIKKIKDPCPGRQGKQRLEIKNCLVLGVGGGDVIRTIRKYLPKAKITGVEIDPVMIEIAQKYFQLGRIANLQVDISDSVSWLKKQQKKNQHDLIVVDLFIGKLNPVKSRNALFLSQLKRLKGQGLILYNSHYREKDRDEYKKFIVLCHSIYKRVEEVFRYQHNRVLLLR